MNPYIERILGLLGEQDAITVLAETPMRLEKLSPVLAQRAGQSYAPGKWTSHKIICHLADVELGYGFRLRQVLAGITQIQPFDQDAWAKRYANLPLPLALEAFKSMRAWNLALFKSVSNDDLNKTVNHPERGPESFGLMMKFLAGHDLNHLDQLKTIAAG